MWATVSTNAHQFGFLVSGILQTIITQYLFYLGAAQNVTMFTVLANYIGMASVFFVLPKAKLVKRSESQLLASNPNDIELMPAPSQLLSGSNILLPSPSAEKLKEHNRYPRLLVAVAAFFDVLGHMMCTFGLIYIGSGVPVMCIVNEFILFSDFL